jgi:hypothetical protein
MLYGDGCACAELLQATHVYAFDRVFSRQTLRALAARLGRCAFFVLVSYRQPKVRPTDRTNEWKTDRPTDRERERASEQEGERAKERERGRD